LVTAYRRIVLWRDQPAGIGWFRRLIQDHADAVALTDLVALVAGGRGSDAVA